MSGEKYINNISLFKNTKKKSTGYIKNFEELKNCLANWKKESQIIQSRFDFIVPRYIVDEIIKSNNKKDFTNLYYLINCAILNKRLSKKNGDMLKQIYN